MLHQARSGSQYGAFPNPKWNVRLLRSTSDRNVVSQVWGKRLSSGFPWWLAIMAKSSFFLHFRHQLSCPSGQVCFLLLTTCPPPPSFTFLSETWVLAKTQVAVRWGWEPACWLFSEHSGERERKRCLTEICFEVFNPDCWSEVVSLCSAWGRSQVSPCCCRTKKPRNACSSTNLEQHHSTKEGEHKCTEDSSNARGRVLKSFDWLVMTDAAWGSTSSSYLLLAPLVHLWEDCAGVGNGGDIQGGKEGGRGKDGRVEKGGDAGEEGVERKRLTALSPESSFWWQTLQEAVVAFQQEGNCFWEPTNFKTSPEC